MQYHKWDCIYSSVANKTKFSRMATKAGSAAMSFVLVVLSLVLITSVFCEVDHEDEEFAMVSLQKEK